MSDCPHPLCWEPGDVEYLREPHLEDCPLRECTCFMSRKRHLAGEQHAVQCGMREGLTRDQLQALYGEWRNAGLSADTSPLYSLFVRCGVA